MQEHQSTNAKVRYLFPCPKCRDTSTKVLMTRSSPHGELIRRRGCPSCGHRWFTCQEPEYLLPKNAVKWSGANFQLVSTTDLSQ